MLKRKIIFRADGNSQIGLGHMYRIYALLEMLNNKYFTIFLSKNKTFVEDNFKNTDASLLVPTNLDIQEEPKWIQLKFPSEECIVVTDGYHFDSNYQKALKSYGFLLICIDDLANHHMYCDLVINHSPIIRKSDYSAELYTQYGLGTKYALLRKSFLNAAKVNRTINKMDCAFICFGGADPNDITLKAVNALLKLSEINKVNVVVGSAYKHGEIFQIKHDKLQIYQNLNEKEMVEVMLECNIAIAPASTISYELCAVRMPLLLGYFTDNQRNIYTGLLEKGAVFGGGDYKCYDINNFIDKVRVCIKNSKWVVVQLETQYRLFDERINSRINKLIGQVNLGEPKYRKVTPEDEVLIYNWANDPLVRKQSFHSAKISFLEHAKWFKKKLASKSTRFYIAEFDNTPAALIRMDDIPNNTVIGILLDKSFRGFGLSSRVLKDTTTIYFNEFLEPITAYIKKSNIASIKAFEKSGFKYVRIKMINESTSLVYLLEKT